MQFRTEILLDPATEKINYNSKLFFIGSCFSNNIGDKLNSGKIETLVNPFGIVFNPASIKEQLEIIINKKVFSETDVFKHDNVFKSFVLHSSFNNKNKKEYVDSVNQQVLIANLFLKSASHIFITLGSAFAYRHLSTAKIVSNCHKIPQSNFEKVLLSYEEVFGYLKNITSNIKQINTEAKIIFTVSPVKHIKDGIVNDNISKSILIAAANSFALKENNITYFPAYELVNNDLRDYRFYSKDMAHPSEQAIEYVFEKFSSAYFSIETSNLFKEVLQIETAMLHKTMSDDEVEQNKFAAAMLHKINDIENRSSLNMNAAKNHFGSLLHSKI